eukprot:1302835-Amphidinium_carterae.1
MSSKRIATLLSGHVMKRAALIKNPTARTPPRAKQQLRNIHMNTGMGHNSTPTRDWKGRWMCQE